ncbi:unnamed protein product [Strongylus vulgaris]|uniref:Uncharacterized protein n=1 Tax=Strongylus vulgaris TaxID=40348 RepID=A0A3P7M0E6_STRVU|nr:unnamed protein product [Strongylus vulgaris]
MIVITGNRLNPLAPPGFGYPRGPLQYDLNPQYMGGARKTGGRRPKEFEMGPVGFLGYSSVS